MDPRVAKLPVWAQDVIRSQAQTLTDLKARLDRLNAGVYPSDTLRIDSAADHGLVPTLSRSGRFFFGDNPSDFTDFRREHHDPRRIYVHSGWSRLLVMPAAGNSIYLSADRL